MNNLEIARTPPLLRPVDILIVIILLAGTGLTLPAFSNLTPQTITVFRDNRKIGTYPLTTDREITVSGAHGPVIITIKNGAAAVKEANCPHGICRKTGFISRPHAQIVCAPNHLLVTVSSSSPDTLDAIVH